MNLTKRDQLLLSELGNYGLFSTTLIVEKYFNNVDYSTVLRRIRILEKNGFIRRAGLLMTTENLWAIAPHGARTMSLENFKCYWNQASIDHDFKLIKLRMLLEELGIIKKWIAEHVIRSMIYQKNSLREAKNKLIPDGIFETKIENGHHSMAIELELNLKSLNRYKKILGQYQWNKDLLGVWYIVPNLSILNKLKDYWNKTKSYSAVGNIYISILDELKTLKGESLMYSINDRLKLSEFFKMPAHCPAQLVVNNFVEARKNLNQISSRDHTPLIGNPN